jgi:CcmD family protein
MTTLSILLQALLQGATTADTTPYLILGYAVMWLIGTFYVVTLINRQRNLRQDINLLQKLLEEDEQESGESG